MFPMWFALLGDVVWFFLGVDADDANDKVKWENNINKKQHSA
jgi:hypothetical protein